jgi:hypothetical protein
MTYKPELRAIPLTFRDCPDRELHGDNDLLTTCGVHSKREGDCTFGEFMCLLSCTLKSCPWGFVR